MDTYNLDTFKIPLNGILENRREFYNLRRNSSDSMAMWLKRVEHCIDRCEFATIFIKFLLIDRFICELNSVELKTIENADNLTLNQVLEQFSDKNFNTECIEADSLLDKLVNPNAHISLDAVKSEPVCIYSYLSVYFMKVNRNLSIQSIRRMKTNAGTVIFLLVNRNRMLLKKYCHQSKIH